MRAALTEADREVAVSRLRQLDDAALRRVLDDLQGSGRNRKSVEWMVVEVEYEDKRLRSRLPQGERARFLVDMLGVDLLSERRLRLELARAAPRDVLDELHEYPWGQKSRGGSEARSRAIAKRRWVPGKQWPSHFVRALGFPQVFAGIEGSPKPPDSLEVEPFTPLPPLTDFQQELLSQIRKVLIAPEGENRGILTLPTGAGKTRTVVEAFAEWKSAEGEEGVVVWIAQSQELCEQAVQSFRHVWIDQGHRADGARSSMVVSRLWGQHNDIPSGVDVVVATVQKLRSIHDGGTGDHRKTALEDLIDDIGVVLVDEAHRALAPSYGDVLEFLGVPVRHRATSTTALLGLTATPGRTNRDETRRLVNRFHGNLLKPVTLSEDPLSRLRDMGVLSEPDHQRLDPGGEAYELSENRRYKEHWETFGDIPPDLLTKVGEEKDRNKALLEALLDVPEAWPVLFFGTSVEQARAIALLLRRNGRSADVVTGQTRAATRRHLIERFRAGELSVLCNYGVLTTGFDAPTVQAVVVARPTASSILYEQMIGRGMRGPKFGGTPECLILDVQDNITYEGQRAYLRFEDEWG